MMTFLPLPFFTTEASTLAPSTTGVPTVILSPSMTARTLSKVTFSPASLASFSMNRVSPSVTLYCLPPVSMIGCCVSTFTAALSGEEVSLTCLSRCAPSATANGSTLR